jgi:hypothetical protein
MGRYGRLTLATQHPPQLRMAVLMVPMLGLAAERDPVERGAPTAFIDTPHD